MGFFVDAECYDVESAHEEAPEVSEALLSENSLYQYAHCRFDEGLTLAEAAERMHVDIRTAEIMEHRVLRLGRPAPAF